MGMMKPSVRGMVMQSKVMNTYSRRRGLLLLGLLDTVLLLCDDDEVVGVVVGAA